MRVAQREVLSPFFFFFFLVSPALGSESRGNGSGSCEDMEGYFSFSFFLLSYRSPDTEVSSLELSVKNFFFFPPLSPEFRERKVAAGRGT